MRIASPATLTMARIPSYFSSKIHPSCEKGLSMGVASIGAGAGGGSTPLAGGFGAAADSPRGGAARAPRRPSAGLDRNVEIDRLDPRHRVRVALLDHQPFLGAVAAPAVLATSLPDVHERD